MNFADADYSLELLQYIVSQPTAPLHEEGVATRIWGILRGLGLTPQLDPYGNIIARYRHRADSITRPLVLVAHMDHPAFEIVESTLAGVGRQPGALVAMIRGGVAAEVFRLPYAVRIYPKSGGEVRARVTGYATMPDGFGHERGTYLFVMPDDQEGAAAVVSGDWGVWELPDFEADGDWLRARALDDLAGCTAALLTLRRLVIDDAPGDVIAVFTRAEEIGLIGATLVAQQKLVPDGAVVISIETSKALPGAVQGGGPVIRTGDRARTFDAVAENYLRVAAAELAAHIPPVPVQRQLMSAGGCEAMTFGAHGYLVTGVAFPLGNWHNVTDDKTLALENIHRTDFLAGVLLLQTAARLAATATEYDGERARLDQGAEMYRNRLETSTTALRTTLDL